MTNPSTFIICNAREIINNTNERTDVTLKFVPSKELVGNLTAFASAYEYYIANGYELEIFLN
ncbi:MAG: hypothetical protein ACK5L5_05180 [Bacteroidales bacterium]